MKLDELTKFSISLIIIPIIPAWLVYKYICLYSAIVIIGIFWVLAIISLLNKKSAKEMKSTFEKIGAFLGKYISYTVLFFIFIFAVIPTKLLMIASHRDRLKRRSFDEETYWIDCPDINTDYELEY